MAPKRVGKHEPGDQCRHRLADPIGLHGKPEDGKQDRKHAPS
jgi:hypothetical protein